VNLESVEVKAKGSKVSKEDQKLQKDLLLVEQLRQSADAASAPMVKEATATPAPSKVQEPAAAAGTAWNRSSFPVPAAASANSAARGLGGVICIGGECFRFVYCATLCSRILFGCSIANRPARRRVFFARKRVGA
jgi:hypothetical protein